MYNLDQITNACEPVMLAGKSYPIRQLRLLEWGELQAWLKSVCPSPIAQATKGLAELRSQGIMVPQDVQDSLFRQAQEESRRWPPKVGTAAWLRALEDLEGGRARFVRTALEAGGTKISIEEATSIEEMATVDELGNLMRVCLTGEHSVPKAQGEMIPPSPTIGEKSTNGSASSEVSRLTNSEV